MTFMWKPKNSGQVLFKIIPLVFWAVDRHDGNRDCNWKKLGEYHTGMTTSPRFKCVPT